MGGSRSWGLSVSLFLRAVFFTEEGEIGSTGMASLNEAPRAPARGGELNAAISNAIVQILSEFAGRGPTKARTIHSGKLIVCVLEDTMTKAERSLSAGGHDGIVLDGRHALQHTERIIQTFTADRLSRLGEVPALQP